MQTKSYLPVAAVSSFSYQHPLCLGGDPDGQRAPDLRCHWRRWSLRSRVPERASEHSGRWTQKELVTAPQALAPVPAVLAVVATAAVASSPAVAEAATMSVPTPSVCLQRLVQP
jgi:hypothetical protein